MEVPVVVKEVEAGVPGLLLPAVVDGREGTHRVLAIVRVLVIPVQSAGLVVIWHLRFVGRQTWCVVGGLKAGNNLITGLLVRSVELVVVVQLDGLVVALDLLNMVYVRLLDDDRVDGAGLDGRQTQLLVGRVAADLPVGVRAGAVLRDLLVALVAEVRVSRVEQLALETVHRRRVQFSCRCKP